MKRIFACALLAAACVVNAGTSVEVIGSVTESESACFA